MSRDPTEENTMNELLDITFECSTADVLSTLLVSLNRYSINMDIHFNFISGSKEVLMNHVSSVKQAIADCTENPVSAKLDLIYASKTYPNCSFIVFQHFADHYEMNLSLDPNDLPHGLNDDYIQSLKNLCQKISVESKVTSFYGKLETDDASVFSSD